MGKRTLSQNPVSDSLTSEAVASSGEGSNRDWYQSDGERLEVTQVEPSAPSEATTGNDQESKPFMVDIMSGLNCPLAKAFEMAGWRIFAVGWLLGKEHDLSKLDNQGTMRRRLKQADFIWAALDFSDKSTSGRYHASMQTAQPCHPPCEVWSSLRRAGAPRSRERKSGSK